MGHKENSIQFNRNYFKKHVLTLFFFQLGTDKFCASWVIICDTYKMCSFEVYSIEVVSGRTENISTAHQLSGISWCKANTKTCDFSIFFNKIENLQVLFLSDLSSLVISVQLVQATVGVERPTQNVRLCPEYVEEPFKNCTKLGHFSLSIFL